MAGSFRNINKRFFRFGGMKIIAIGDPHGDLEKVKKIPTAGAELILLTGDLGSANLMRRLAFERIERERQGLPPKEYSTTLKRKAFMEAYSSSVRIVKYLSRIAPVYVIFGNVESSNSETRKMSREIGVALPYLYNELNSMPDVRVINNVVGRCQNIRIGGLQYFVDTNWVKDFSPSHYQRGMGVAKKETEKASRILKQFGTLDVLVCHQPPYGILDKVTAKFAPENWQGKHAGSKTILEYIKTHQPRYVFCGHIHEGEGMKRIGRAEIYNLGVCGYKMIELDR